MRLAKLAGSGMRLCVPLGSQQYVASTATPTTVVFAALQVMPSQDVHGSVVRFQLRHRPDGAFQRLKADHRA